MGIDTATERDSTFSDRADDRVSAAVVVFGAIAGLVVLATAFWVLWSGVGHGFDVTDEGFYLRSADAPGPEYAFVGLWGAYLHPLFWMTGFDIAKYRALGIVLLACAALLQSYGLRRALAGRFDRPPTPGRTGLLVRVCLDTAVVAGAITYYSLFLVTPSYNWLTLVGVLVCSGGALALLAPARGTRWDLVDPVLVAVGSLLALASRPTAGIGLWVAVTVLVLALSARPMRRRLTDLAVVVAATLVLGVVHLLFISGWSNTLAIIRRTMYVGQNDIGGHSLPDLIHSSGHQVKFVVPGVWHLVGAWPLAGFVVLAAALAPLAVRARVAGLLGAGCIVAVTAAIWVNGGFRGGHGVQFLLPFAGFALIFTALAVAVSSTVLQLLPGAPSPRAAVLMRSWRVLVCGLFLLATALLYTFSSNNGLIYQLWGGFGVLALVALFLLAAGLETKALPVVAGTMAVVCASVALTVLSQASKSPYDTPPVAEDTTRVTVSGHGATLLTSPDYAAALESIRSQAVAAGWKAGTPLIDLTPFFPGIGYMLDARPPTTIMTGFAPEVAAWTLAQQDRAVFRDAWVLVKANNAPRPLKSLSVLGRTFPDDYVKVASVEYPLGHIQLELWRPSTP